MSTASSISSIQRLLQDAVNKKILPGAVIQIVRNDETIYQDAFGLADKKTGRPHKMEDLFYLGSTSKPLFVTAIMSLVDEGKLQLNAPASTWFPELHKPKLSDGTEVRSPTIAEMLSHRSGIFGNATASRSQQQLVWNFKSNLSDVAKKIASQPLVYPPGSGFSYGGASMTIVGSIAEIITNKEFDEYAKNDVFSKLGMNNTFYRTDNDVTNCISVLYSKSAARLYKTRFQPDARIDSFVLPPGGIISTAMDLSKFLQLHLSKGRSNSYNIISNKLINEMRRDFSVGLPMDFKFAKKHKHATSIAKSKGYGLGWMLDDIDQGHNARIFFHGGAFGTLIWGDTISELGIILLTHIPLSQVAKLWDDIINIVIKAFGCQGSR